MSQTYIRIAKTPYVKKALADLHARYSLLTEAEIIRLLLSEAHKKEVEEKMEEEQKIREAYKHALEEGGKIGDKILAKKGLKRENMTEQQLYEAIFGSSKRKS